MFRNPLIDALVVVFIALVVFGPKRLPMLGRALGQGLREFKEGITGQSGHDDDEEKPALTPAATAPSTAEQADARAPVTAPSTGSERESAEAGSSEQRG